MSLLSLHGLRLDFGGPPILDGIDLSLDAGERVCLLGRNGAGKSSLLSLLLGRLQPDGGEIRRDPETRIAELPQDIPAVGDETVADVVASGLGDLAGLVAEYARLTSGTHVAAAADDDRLAELTSRIEASNGWDLAARTARVLDQLSLDGDQAFADLSGGSRRRVLLGRALVSDPDVLLLDEPTNHLDVETIEWLEGVLSAQRGAVLFTSHDRRFVQKVATRIVDLDRGRLTSHPGDWDTYIAQREARLEAEARAASEFDRRLAEEEVWIRQGIKARRTRNEGRVRRLEAMRDERRARRDLVGTARISVRQADASGRRVLEARDVDFAYDDGLPLVRGFSTLVERGDRIGVLGRNGTGKTTLLRLLLGELEPDAGTIERGTRLSIAFFDQHREDLDRAASDEVRVQDFVADGDDHVETADGRRHVIGWLQDFLFTPDRSRGPVSVLSGGERARLQLARLFAKPSNLLVLDEPTNDLDVETLELLEERLLDYAGTVLLVSHDRAFLDRVVTSTLVLEVEGRVGEYVGGYEDWVRQRPTPAIAEEVRPAVPTPRSGAESASAVVAPARSRRLGFREQRELEGLPARIEALETTIEALQQRLADPAIYRDAPEEVPELTQSLREREAELEAAFERWTELDG